MAQVTTEQLKACTACMGMAGRFESACDVNAGLWGACRRTCRAVASWAPLLARRSASQAFPTAAASCSCLSSVSPPSSSLASSHLSPPLGAHAAVETPPCLSSFPKPILPFGFLAVSVAHTSPLQARPLNLLLNDEHLKTSARLGRFFFSRLRGAMHETLAPNPGLPCNYVSGCYACRFVLPTCIISL